MFWLNLFNSLGFIGFYTIWAALVGCISIFGIAHKFFKKSIVTDFILSWFFGIFLISNSPIGSLMAAVFIRILATGLLKSFKLRGDTFTLSREGISLVAAPIIVIIFLYLLAAVFAPPREVAWYYMNDVPITKLEKLPTTNINDIVWDDIKDMRIVAQEYALQIPKTLITETGWRLSDDWDGIYPVNKTLYWVMAYEPDKLMNFKEPSPAYIMVNAQNPSDRKKISESISYSEERNGLIEILYQIINGKIRDINLILWLKYPYLDFGDSIFTHNDKGEPVWIAPAKMRFPTIFIVKFYTDQVGIAEIDNEGKAKFYSRDEIKNKDVPDWLLEQILIDEQYTETRIYKWAKFNSWKGFIDYNFQHENVFEPVGDLYFQYEKQTDHRYALMQLEPEGWKRKSITHFIEIDASGQNYGNIAIYDCRSLGLIGPERALDDVRGQISLYRDWYPLQPLFKKIKDGYFYVIPIYSGVREAMVLRSIAVVDAKSEQVKLFGWKEVPVSETANATGSQKIADIENCKIVSTQTINGKLRITVECG